MKNYPIFLTVLSQTRRCICDKKLDFAYNLLNHRTMKLILPKCIVRDARDTNRLLCECGAHYNINKIPHAQLWVLKHSMCDAISLTNLASAIEEIN